MVAHRAHQTHRLWGLAPQALENRIDSLRRAVQMRGGRVLTIRRDGRWSPGVFFAAVLYEIPVRTTTEARNA